MKVHKIEMIICDPNGEYEDIKDVICDIENYITEPIIHIVKTQTKEAGEWKDNSPLNFTAKRANNYFGKLDK